MESILDIIKKEISQDYYQQNYPNDGQRFVAWYMRNIHLLDQCQTKDAVTDGANDKQIDAVYIDEDEQKYISFKVSIILAKLLMQNL